MFLVPAAVKHLEDLAKEINDYLVTVTLLTKKKLVATVQMTKSSYAIVTLIKKELGLEGVVVSQTVATCTICRKHEDTGLLCPEMVAAVLCSQKKPNGSTWSLYDLEFATEVRYTSTWLAQLNVHIPLFPFVPNEQSSAEQNDDVLRCWQYPPPRSVARPNCKLLVKLVKKP